MSLRSDNIAFETDSSDLPHFPLQAGSYEITLRVASLDQVVPHEHYHGRRVEELVERLLVEEKLINPPIVARHGQKYVVLDGATRLTALRMLGFPSIIVQVVELSAQHVQLTSWSHAIFGGSSAGLLKVLANVPGLKLAPVPMEEAGSRKFRDERLGEIVFEDGRRFWLTTHSTTAQPAGELWLDVLNSLVERYGQWGNVERTLTHDLESLRGQYPDLAALIIFPTFSPQRIFELADQGRTVPAGITRFIIPGRILRLNAPLQMLKSDAPLAVKQAWLNDLLREKLVGRQMRFYEEPVILLDE